MRPSTCGERICAAKAVHSARECGYHGLRRLPSLNSFSDASVPPLNGLRPSDAMGGHRPCAAALVMRAVVLNAPSFRSTHLPYTEHSATSLPEQIALQSF